MNVASGSEAARLGLLAATARGAGWVVAWRLMTRLFGLASTLVLVRLLPPGDFGLVALATAFALALDVCLAIGVEDQIVRARDPRRELYDTAFTLNLLRSLLLAAILVLVATRASDFFGDPRLHPVFLALAASAAANGLTNVAVADFRRHLAFEKEFRLQFLPRVAGIAVGIGTAFLLRSHWALILAILVNRAGIVAMSYVLHPFRPRLSLVAWRDLVGVSAWSWANSLASVVRDRADSLVIGRVLGPTRLGVYSVGAEVAVLPTTEVVDPICRACMPGFATALREDGPVSASDAYLRIVAVMALLTLPAGVGISAVAGPVVAVAFGPAWLEAVPVVAILGVACTLTLFGNVSGAMLSARTALRTILAITITSAALRVLLLLLLVAPFGLTGAALAVGLAVASEAIILVGCALRLLHLPPRRFLARVARPVIATAIMALGLWSAGLAWAAPPDNGTDALRLLLITVPFGAALYALTLGASWLAAGRPTGAEEDLLRLLRRIADRLLAMRPRLQPLRGT